MKKSLLSLLLFALFSFHTNAQIFTTCNPEFSWQFLSNATVKFNPVTTDSPFVQHYWNFGDGSQPGNLISPVHTYAPGTYSVKHYLVRHNPNGVLVCSDSAVHQITIQGTCNLNASFTFQPTATNPLLVYFLNTSIGFSPGDSIRWTFGDGTVSYTPNTSHLYANAGTYTVCLRVKKPQTSGTATPCVSETCVQVQVVSSTPICNIQAYFSIDSLQPNVYHFVNQSPGYMPGDSIRWTFGDGTSSTDASPTHTYTASGTYTICIRISRITIPGAPPCVREYCKTKTVTLPVTCNLNAQFTSIQLPTTANPYTFYFTNTTLNSSATDSIRWTFGDGTSANQMNPIHGYAQPGAYNVCLRVQKRNSAGVLSNCISEICHVLTIQQQCNIQAHYTKHADSLNFKKIYFTNTTLVSGLNAAATWSFGDGATASGWNAVHEYAQGGRYYVCLRVQSGSCVSYSCDSLTVSVPTPVNCTGIALGFTESHDSLVPNRIKFIGNSNTYMPNQRWTITRMPANGINGTVTIYQNNPTYVFLDSGYYNVCLRVSFAGGCVKEYCRIIHITQSMPGTSSCALQVYPNPASTVINAGVTLIQPLILNAYVYNGMNMLVAQKQQQGVVGSNTVSINIASLPAGAYSVRLYYGNNLCTSTFLKL